MEKYYSVEDVAIMTGMTSRTIHNYIKQGKLTGRKIGVQWRFTDEEIQSLFNDDKIKKDVLDFKNKSVLEFINNKNRNKSETCSIIDVSCKQDMMIELIHELIDYVNLYENNGISIFHYQYLDSEKLARIIIIGELDKISSCHRIIQRYELKQ